MSQKPNFFILGAPKCGTTSLAQWLSEHPRIYMSPVKEPNYFNTDMKIVNPLNLAEYESLFAGANDRNACIGEATTAYLRSKNAVNNILRYCPEARFIVCIRNPIEMSVSLHGERLKEGFEKEVDFERAWELQRDRAKGEHVPILCTEITNLMYGETCKIGAQLDSLIKKVGRERVHVVCLDDMKLDPRSEYEKALDFLGVKKDFYPDFKVYNEAIYVPGFVSRLLRVYIQIKRKLRIRPQTGLMRPLRKLFSSKNGIKKPSPYFVRNTLYPYFLDDIRILEEILERDFSCWAPNDH